MDIVFLTHPTAGGLAGAVGAVVAGAPLFSDGLRALRLRRRLRRLGTPPASCAPGGFGHVEGTVALESPLFAPLSARPCAAFRLELRAEGAPIAATVGEERSFRVVSREGLVHVEADDVRWRLPHTAEREVAPDEVLSGTLARWLESSPEVLLWRRSGGRLRLIERALVAGAACHVVGRVERVRAEATAVAVEDETVLLRTGTDGVPEVVETGAARGRRDAWHATGADGPELWVGPDGLVDFTLVSDRAPTAADLAMPRWRTFGVLIGPVLSLLGLLYLAAAVDALRGLGH